MKQINTTLLSYVFIGLIGCGPSLSPDEISQYTYKGDRYATYTVSEMGSIGSTVLDTSLYVCKNGRWVYVVDNVEQKIYNLKTDGKLVSSKIGDAPDDDLAGEPCLKLPKQPKKSKPNDHIVVDEVTIVPKVTGTDDFEGGD